MLSQKYLFISAITFSTLLALSSCEHNQTKESLPNFIFYITDDISFNDIGCYGNELIKTPHIDQMAAEGLAFDNAYLTASSCSPTRCSIITGRYPHNTGSPELHTTLPDNQVMFPKLLKNAGYYTVLSGKNHMGPVTKYAFDTISGGGGPGMQEDWVEMLSLRPKNKPFFFWFGSYDAHRPWQIDSTKAPVYNPDSVKVPPMLYDGPLTRQDIANYYHEISRADYYLGSIREELKRQEIEENTYIFFCSDNGRPFPRCKVRLYDSGIKTHLVVYGPNVKKGRTQALISVIDIAPTIMELAGLNKHQRMQGVSFTKLFSDHNGTIRHFSFSEHNWHVYQGHERMVHFGNWIYIRNWFPCRRIMSVESSPYFPAGKELWTTYEEGLTEKRHDDIFLETRPEHELYHIKQDPYQFNNLINNEKYEDTLKFLNEVLNQWIKETGDHVPAPITKDSRVLPNEQIDNWEGFQQMAGAALGADTIINPGPVLLDDKYIKKMR
jgi:N-sulfoglucosamine sulfohydrolase